MREDILVVRVIESVGGHHVLVHHGVIGHAHVVGPNLGEKRRHGPEMEKGHHTERQR